MRTILFIVTVVFLVSCGPEPDSTGKVYDIKPLVAKKQLYKSLNELIEDDEDHHEAYYRRGKLYFEDGEYSKAYKDANKALTLESDNADYKVLKILVLSKMKRHQTVLRLVEDLGSKYQLEEVKKAKLIAEIRTGKINNPELIEESLEGLGISKSLELYLKGMASWKRKDTIKAKIKLEEAFEQGERAKDLLHVLIDVYPPDSSKYLYYLNVAATKYKDEKIRVELADYYRVRGNVIKEDSVYQVLLTADPNNYKVLVKKGMMLIQQKKYRELIRLLSPHYEDSKTTEDDRLVADAYFILRENVQAKQLYRLLEPDDTTGVVKKNLNIITWRFSQKKKLADTLSTIGKDSVNLNP